MTDPRLSIRDERPEDHAATRRVTIDAFTNSELGYEGEADLVDRLRVTCDRFLSLVACAGDEIVGHVLFTPLVIRGADHEGHGMGLAPLSVATSRQRAGVGTALVQAGLARLDEEECPFVVVLGHPDYYPRFGFEPVAEFGVVHGFEGVPQELFFIRFHVAVPEVPGGRAYYRGEFGPQHES